MNTIGIRSCYDEGKRVAEIRVARIFIVQPLRGVPLTLYGDGSQTRSFCYVDDLEQVLEPTIAWFREALQP